ncbi:SRPBCC family protein [Lysinibacillus capsici]|uniref:SRPBCC family protein n=1 Tax=Lysinibacillus capsici TaxID=2115968 RepID=UPI0021530771|nr:SRPBCC family protein [Lysinibacillus capsici]MCR6522420.1 SRPBCC family protein [Lysinibacillus capsici]
MKTWTKTININSPIENVWKLLDGSLADMQKIMPQVIENKPVKVTEEGVGSIYRQKYKEGKRIETYDVETLEYSNTPDKKILKVGFVLANLFEITAYYELNKINETETSFTYSVTNNALKWFVKLFLLFASDKVVVQFLDRVKTVAEAQD